MNYIKKISSSFENTIKDSNLHNIATSGIEILLDQQIDEGIARDIPVVGTIIGLGKAYIGVKDHLFLKKIIYFINEIKDIPLDERHSMIDKINNSGNYRSKVGENLIYIIDKSSDHEMSQIIARMFSAFLLEKISYSEFLRASHIINQLIYDDLKWFVEGGWNKDRKNNNFQYNYPNEQDTLLIEEAGSIATTSLVQIISPEIEVQDNGDWKSRERGYIVEGSDLMVCITDIGKKIRNILKDFF